MQFKSSDNSWFVLTGWEIKRLREELDEVLQSKHKQFPLLGRMARELIVKGIEEGKSETAYLKDKKSKEKK